MGWSPSNRLPGVQAEEVEFVAGKPERLWRPECSRTVKEILPCRNFFCVTRAGTILRSTPTAATPYLDAVLADGLRTD